MKVTHPKYGYKVTATIYEHLDDENEALAIAKNISGGFVLKNNRTKKYTIFYETPKIDFGFVK